MMALRVVNTAEGWIYSSRVDVLIKYHHHYPHSTRSEAFNWTFRVHRVPLGEIGGKSEREGEGRNTPPRVDLFSLKLQ